MPRRKRLLFVTDVFPFPLDRGHHIRIFNLLAACARACDVTFIGPSPSEGIERNEIEQLCERVLYVAAEPLALHKQIIRVAQTVRVTPGIPWPAKVRRYERYVAPLREARPQSFDLIWAERPYIARLCKDFRAQTIIDLDDIEHVKIEQLLRLDSPLSTRALNTYRYYYFRHIELYWSRTFRATVVCSEKDRQYLADRGCKNVVVVPNAPNARPKQDFLGVGRLCAGSPLRMAFLGNVEAAPNADAISFLAEEILPELRKYVPHATVDVIGPGATPNIRQKYASKIAFRGFVDDLAATLREYHLLIAPLRFGAGTKLKVLDAMYYGVPVVTTPAGAEGLYLTHGDNVWLAETVPAIVEGIRRIFTDAVLAERLAMNAQTHVQSHFSWTAIQDQLAEWLCQLE